MAKWSRWKSILAAVMVGFAESTGLDVGRPDINTPFRIVQIEESDVEIPWEWVPGLMVLPEDERELNLPDPQEPPQKTGWLKGLVKRLRTGLHRFDGIAGGPAPAPVPAG